MTDAVTVDDGPFGPVVRPREGSGACLLHLDPGPGTSARAHAIELATALSARTGATVVCTRYRPAFPDALDDVDAAYRFCRDVGPVAVVGERLGAWLAATVMIRLRDSGDEQPWAAVLIGALLDLTMDSRSLRLQTGVDPGFNVDVLRERVAAWGAGSRPAGLELNPITANLHGLPPTQLIVAGTDPLLDDSLAFAARAAHDRVPVELRVTADREALRVEAVPAAAEFLGRWPSPVAAPSIGGEDR
jgi:monoterpene epsilon-lactone hydrolase